MSEDKALVKKEPTFSERFVAKVVSEMAKVGGDVPLTDFQKRLAQNYAVSIDYMLKTLDEKRIKGNVGKSEKYQKLVPIIWANINMEQLSRDVVSSARIGLDPAQKNHINMIPFINNTTKKYDIGFIDGYRGMELKAMKYGLDIPDSVIIELVYSTDNFIPIKKDHRNKVESYEFNITNPFDRGDIRGGFYYHVYTNNPEKNKLVMLSMKDIEKRKPPKASVEFWGGEKDEWKDGKRTGNKEHVEGWLDQMCYKTVARAAYDSITIDSQKIDNDYMQLKQNERSFKDAEVVAEIALNANSDSIDIESEHVIEPDKIIDATVITEKEQTQPGPGF